MAVNLINSNDIEISQNGDDIQLNTTVDIQTMQNGITTNTNDITSLKNSKIYSTEEVDTGQKWINGKTIYRKVITGTTTTTNASFTVAHGITNYENIMIDGKSFIKSVGASTFIIPANCPPNTTDSYNRRPVRTTIVDDNISIYIGDYNGYSSYDYAIILEYTKTS